MVSRFLSSNLIYQAFFCMQLSKAGSKSYSNGQDIPDQFVVFSSSNRHFAVIGKGTKTLIYDSRSMKQIAKQKIISKLAYFQYDSGLIALVPFIHDNKVIIWDFKYDRIVREMDFVKPIVKLSYMKNLLVVVSTDRLMMHDLSSKENTVYMPLEEGEKCLISSFFEKLRVGYFSKPGLFVNLGMWDDTKIEIEEVAYEKGEFDYKGDTVLLYNSDGILVYRGRCLTNRIKYDPSKLVGCVFDAAGLDQPKGIVLVLKRNGDLVIEWHPIYRLAKEHDKNIKYRYELMFQEILESQLEDFEKTMIYIRDGDLHICTPGEEAQIYKKVEILTE